MNRKQNACMFVVRGESMAATSVRIGSSDGNRN
jgi:hypothetical protein